MTVTPVIAPYAGTYAGAVRYVTVDEFLAEPTGVDVSQLAPRRGPAEQKAALGRLLDRASGVTDNYCNQTLAATLEVESGRYRLGRDGYFRVPCASTPIVEVRGVTVGLTPDAMTALSSLTGTWIDRKVVSVPYGGAYSGQYSALTGSNRWFVALSYVAGFPCTTTASSTTAGTTSLPVASTLAIYPGMALTIADGASTETVTVAPAGVVGSAVQLTAATQYDHAAGVAVDALPGSVKQAVIQIAAGLVRARGNGAVVLASLNGQPSQKAAGQDGKVIDLTEAAAMLQPFQRVI